MYRINKTLELKSVFIAFATINGLYTSVWDLIMDFSKSKFLFQAHATNLIRFAGSTGQETIPPQLSRLQACLDVLRRHFLGSNPAIQLDFLRNLRR